MDEMLADLTPEEWDEIKAAYITIPLPDPWLQAGTIAAAFHNKIEEYFAAKAGQRKVDPRRLTKAEQYIPKVRNRKKPKVDLTAVDDFQARLEQQFNGPNR